MEDIKAMYVFNEGCQKVAEKEAPRIYSST